MLQSALQNYTALQDYVGASNQFYQDLLGYKPEQTRLQFLNQEQWQPFCERTGLNQNSSGIYLPRNQTAVIPSDSETAPLSLFHEYFGHGLYCEQSLSGRRLVNLEKVLLEEERMEFLGRQFTLEDIQKFRNRNQTFKKLIEHRRQNLAQYELFAIWTEHLLSGEFDLMEMFDRKYDGLSSEIQEQIDGIVNFNQQYGNLAAFYSFGLARRTTPERVKKLMEEVYRDKLSSVRFAVLYGSGKEFSDIDVFAVSDTLEETYTGWLDINVVSTRDFEEGVKLLDVEVSHPLSVGEFVLGDRCYFEKFKTMLNEQPITEEAITHNLRNSREQRSRALWHPEGSRERRAGDSYSETYLANSVALKEGKKLFTRENLLEYLHSEKFIELSANNRTLDNSISIELKGGI